MTIGQAIKNIRRQRGLTQESLAAMTGYRPSQISLWETDGVYPSILTCFTLADVLECTLDELVGRQVAKE